MLLNFDYDGVIADSLTALVAIAAQAQGELGLGRSPTAADFAQLDNLTFPDLAQHLGIPVSAIETYVQRVFQLQHALPPQPLFAGIVPILHHLAQDHTLVVITSSQGTAVTAALAHQRLGTVMTAVLGGDLGLTKADRIVQAQMLTGFDPQDTYMIGDAVSDVRQGKAAGVKTAAVTWGFQSRQRLIAEQPDWICDRPQDLLALL